MGCRLIKPIAPCSGGFSVPGVQRLWLARKANAMEFRYTGDELGIITYILTSQGNPCPFMEFECDGDFVAPDETLQINQRGRTFPQSLPLRFAQMEYSKRAVLESMIQDLLVAVVEDNNKRLWLLGQDNGLQVQAYSAKTETNGGANGYTCTLVGLERFQMREVLVDNFIYVSPNESAGGAAVIANIGGDGPNGGITDILNTWGQYESGFMIRPMPLSQLGNQPIQNIIQ